jgi:hypothetical protein
MYQKFNRKGWITCKGHCKKKVPPHVTPEICKYCETIQKCLVCNGPLKKTGFCQTCWNNDHPSRSCICGKIFSSHKSNSECDTCKDVKNKELFIKSFGDFHEDYVIKVKMHGYEFSHCGYCSGDDNISNKPEKLKTIMYFAAPKTWVESIDEMHEGMKIFRLDNFNEVSCYCGKNETRYEEYTYELVHKTPHMSLTSWIIFYNR